MSLSGRLGGPHVIVVQAMLGLFEDTARTVVLRDFKLVAVGAVEGDQTGLGNVSEGKDVGNPVRAIPYFTIARDSAAQFGDGLPGLSVYSEAAANFMDIA